MTTLLEQAKAALDKAKISLMLTPDSVFFTTLCFSLRQRFDENVPTAGTNGRDIVWGPDFVVNRLVDNEERVFLMLHETMHAAYLHMDRMPKGGCHDRWNIACDHVINLQLIERGFKMPTKVPGHADPQFRGMGAEEVYKLLPDNPGKPSMKDLMPGEGDPDELARDMDDILVRAQIQSKMAGDKPGTIPGSIEIYLDKLLNPKLPWNKILQKYLNSFTKNDYSFKKPNRRFFPKYHLPSLFGMKLQNITVAVDTSGSVSARDFQVFVSEVASILKMMKPDEMTFLQFDTCIKGEEKIKNIQELLRTKFVGGGGTIITDVLEYCRKKKPQLLLVFSDGEFNFSVDHWKGTETIWLIHDDRTKSFNPPFGKTIHYSSTS